MNNIKITAPLSQETVNSLKAGDFVYITGTIYSARDAAHARMAKMIADGESLPFPIEGSVIYYMGPSPAREGRVIGSAGPTTSGRMDSFTPGLLRLGLKGMIGKGKRSEAVKTAVKETGAVYFAAVGGAGALLSHCIKASEVIAFDDLGPEAIRKLEVEDFPAVVVLDKDGNDLYEQS